MTDALLVLRKLALLREHLARAKRRRPDDVSLLEADIELQDALAMALFVAIQEALDIAFHVVADEGWGVPASNAESFDLLSRNGLIPRELANQMSAAANLRNRIAHGYATLDVARLWGELPAGLESLDRYSEAIAEYVARATKQL